jgi:sulfate adenylyltransferase subunit 1 (EFTu-like GTPase family)
MPVERDLRLRRPPSAATVSATVTELKYQINVNSLAHLAAKKLELNEIGVGNLGLGRRTPARVLEFPRVSVAGAPDASIPIPFGWRVPKDPPGARSRVS